MNLTHYLKTIDEYASHFGVPKDVVEAFKKKYITKEESKKHELFGIWLLDQFDEETIK